MSAKPAAATVLAVALAGCGETPAPNIDRLLGVIEAEHGTPVRLTDIRRDHSQRYTLIYAHEGREARASFRYVDGGWHITREHDARMRLRYF